MKLWLARFFMQKIVPIVPKILRWKYGHKLMDWAMIQRLRGGDYE